MNPFDTDMYSRLYILCMCATYIPLLLCLTLNEKYTAPSKELKGPFYQAVLALSRAIVDDLLKAHKDKNYLAWLSSYDKEESKDK